MIARLLLLFSVGLLAAVPASGQSRDEIERTMRWATTFMVEEVAAEGGYLWAYLPDMSRRWGEAEAFSTMIWIQPPGTATMGQLFLDAYHATGDEYYYRAAEQVGQALVRGQHRSGGWGYFIDFGGPESTRRWYETIGRNAWRMSEFHHPADDATFDDAGTVEAGIFLLRLYLEKNDPRFRPALDRAVGFVLDSQYPIGGWPQRWPPDPDAPDYARLITFNDEVAAENLRFLLLVWQTLGGERVRDAITRGMNAFIVTQGGPEQPGWGLQHSLETLQPEAARSYEPRALSTHTTASNIRQLLDFYRLTGDSRFLARVPEALDWLETVRLPAGQVREGRAFPTFVEIGTNRPIYVHRRGSNARNGEYYWDYSPEATIGHYSAFRAIDVAAMRREYEELRRTPGERLRATSPLYAPAASPLPRFMVTRVEAGSDLNAGGGGSPAEIIAALNPQGYWPTPLRATSHPYRGPAPAEVAPGDYRTTHVGDASDTSPHPTDRPVTGISTATYIANMARLIAALEERAGE
ncbi:pectate lyase [Sphingosinicella terrae]|uniref:pectate lyase n=1 Tax=Sphingosinicella terrae TaxID=2172047 RepID=UPI002548915C|nr:pectate lyase [Sphingosinicella terrae]